MTCQSSNSMKSWIDKYNDSLNDKPQLASIYDDDWRHKTESKLLEFANGEFCYLGNAFGYQAPSLEHLDLIPKGWQYRLEEGAKVLLTKLCSRDSGHLMKRMKDTESASAEQELLLARGFALVFEENSITVPPVDSPQAEFEVNASGHQILVEAKGRLISQAVEQDRKFRRYVKDLLGITILDPPVFDETVDQWIKRKICKTLQSKSRSGCGFVLVLSLYTTYTNLNVADLVRELVINQASLNIPEEQWALTIALVSGGSIQGVWFNHCVCKNLGIEEELRERIRAAIKASFYPWRNSVFFHEEMTDEEHRSMKNKLFGL